MQGGNEAVWEMLLSTAGPYVRHRLRGRAKVTDTQPEVSPEGAHLCRASGLAGPQHPLAKQTCSRCTGLAAMAEAAHTQTPWQAAHTQDPWLAAHLRTAGRQHASCTQHGVRPRC